MPSPTAATIRRKKTPGPPEGSRKRRRAGTSKASARTRLAARRLRPIAIIAAGVFLVAYILDWDSITTLIWACLDGQFGLQTSIVSFAVLFLLVFTAALIWHRPMPAPSVKAVRKTRRPAQPKKAAPTEPEAAIPPDTLPPDTLPPDTVPTPVDVGAKRPRKPKVAS